MNVTPRLLQTIFGFIFFAGQNVHAHFVSSVDANLGFSSYRIELSNVSKELQSPTTIEVNYSLKQSSTGLAYNFSMFEMLTSNEGTLNYTRFSAGLKYFPFGMNGQRVILDNQTQATVWKPTSFVGINLGIANISTKEFNASIMELSPRFGVEIPLSSNFLMQGQLLLASGSSAGGSSARSIKITGVSAMLGFIITNL